MNEPVEQKESMLNRVRELKDHPALLGWVLGNEIPESVLIEKGNEVFESALNDLFNSIKKIDSAHPLTHSNWPPAKLLDLHFFDIISFNIYPVWPPEVVAQGYGNYIKNVIQPIAKDKPLLVTEFGVNTLEAREEGQARIVKQCWEEILEAGACGGFIFSFADEWWKNYDNPQSSGNYWFRKHAPDDELQHDQDPEEHYGIMTAQRDPKPAYKTVQQMFQEQQNYEARLIPAAIMGLLIILAVGIWYRDTR